VNIAQVADELYGLIPSEFTAARNERARAARGSGDRDLAEAISRLRRPTVSAWLVNLLTRQAADLVESVMELGEALREAQQAMAGDRLRELSIRRRELLGKLAQEARRVAARSGQQVGAQAEREAMGTFEAALVDPRVADAVRSGDLTSPISYAGLGAAAVDEEVEEPVSLLEWARSRGRGPGTEDGHAGREPPERGSAGQAERGSAAEGGTAAERGSVTERGTAERGAGRERGTRKDARTQTGGGTRAARQTGGGTRVGRQTDRRQAAARQAAERDALAARRRAREGAEAEAELRAADEEVRQAQAALADAERQVSRARNDHQAIRQRIEELEQRLEQATAQESQSLAALRQARRGRDAAARSLTASQRRLARAQAKAGRQP
jgi:hypothetical protein